MQIIFRKIPRPTLREVLAFDDKTQRDTGPLDLQIDLLIRVLLLFDLAWQRKFL